MQNSSQRILVMRYRFIGDTLLSVPFFRNLRRKYPHAQIDALLAPDSAELLRDCPYIDSVMLMPAKGFWKTLARIRHQRYDKVYVLKRSLSSAFLAFLSGIPNRVGFVGAGCDRGRAALLTQGVPYALDPDAHERDRFLSVLQAEGAEVDDGHLESWWGEPEAVWAKERYHPYQNFYNLGINLTSSNPLKQWPLQDATRWPQVIQILAEQTLQTQNNELRLHALGSPQDSLAVEAVRAQLPAELKPVLVNHCGQTTLLESMAFLSHLQGMLGVDSGILHMAAAVGLPVVALFGPMNEHQWKPLTTAGTGVVNVDLPCRPCNLKIPCLHQYQCLTDISAGQVASEAIAAFI